MRPISLNPTYIALGVFVAFLIGLSATSSILPIEKDTSIFQLRIILFALFLIFLSNRVYFFEGTKDISNTLQKMFLFGCLFLPYFCLPFCNETIGIFLFVTGIFGIVSLIVVQQLSVSNDKKSTFFVTASSIWSILGVLAFAKNHTLMFQFQILSFLPTKLIENIRSGLLYTFSAFLILISFIEGYSSDKDILKKFPLIQFKPNPLPINDIKILDGLIIGIINSIVSVISILLKIIDAILGYLRIVSNFILKSIRAFGKNLRSLLNVSGDSVVFFALMFILLYSPFKIFVAGEQIYNYFTAIASNLSSILMDSAKILLIVLIWKVLVSLQFTHLMSNSTRSTNKKQIISYAIVHTFEDLLHSIIGLILIVCISGLLLYFSSGIFKLQPFLEWQKLTITKYTSYSFIVLLIGFGIIYAFMYNKQPQRVDLQDNNINNSFLSFISLDWEYLKKNILIIILFFALIIGLGQYFYSKDSTTTEVDTREIQKTSEISIIPEVSLPEVAKPVAIMSSKMDTPISVKLKIEKIQEPSIPIQQPIDLKKLKDLLINALASTKSEDFSDAIKFLNDAENMQRIPQKTKNIIKETCTSLKAQEKEDAILKIQQMLKNIKN